MKLLITGGHLTPALSLLEHLPKDSEVVYVGRKYALEGDSAESLEYQTISKRGISFISFHPVRLQRTFTLYSISSLSRIPYSIWQVIHILKREKPDVVISFGGYVALPIALASYLLHIPLVTHEQTFGAGITNRIIARFATFVCISWKQSEKYFPAKKTVLTGNPLVADSPSQEIQKILADFPKNMPLIVVTGGSLGSHVINTAVEAVLPQLLEKYAIFHQTGDAQEFKDYDRLQKHKEELPKTLQERYTLVKFIDPADITYTYKKADLVISRSGANTVQLLLLLDKPALLIPLLVGQKNEQKTNADYFVSCGLGQELSQLSVTPETFLGKIEEMMQKRNMYANTKIREQRALHEKATDRMIECIYAAYRKNKT